MLRFLVGAATAALLVAGLTSGQIPGLGPSGPPYPCGSDYQVQAGDTLFGVAERVYGNSTRYRDIFEANRDRLTSPARIEVGDVLTIPCPEPAETRARRDALEAELLAAIEGQIAEPTGTVPDATPARPAAQSAPTSSAEQKP